MRIRAKRREVFSGGGIGRVTCFDVYTYTSHAAWLVFFAASQADKASLFS